MLLTRANRCRASGNKGNTMLEMHGQGAVSPLQRGAFGLSNRGSPGQTAGPPSTQRGRGYAGPERRAPEALVHRRMVQMLDEIDYGMLLLTEDHCVAHVNKAARHELDAQHPLQLLGTELRARHSRDVAPLRQALDSASQRGLRRLLPLGEAESRVSVAVVPLPALVPDALRGVVLVLGKRQVCQELTVDWFARSHRLTLAETVVTKGLCADLTPQEIALRQGVGLATIRSQIGSIRTKTGAASIRALVRQVSLLPPLVNALQNGQAGCGGEPDLAGPAAGLVRATLSHIAGRSASAQALAA